MRAKTPRVRDPHYLEWLHDQPCVKCEVDGTPQTTRTEAAHCKLAIASKGWRGWGLSEKSDDNKALPLCSHHHRTGRDAEHNIGQRQFWDRIGVCPADLCEALVESYQNDEPVNMARLVQALRNT